jgi:serine protease Do
MRSRIALALALLGLFSSPTICAAGPQRDPRYELAENAFQSTFNVDQRIFIQMSLIAAGYLNAVPNENFNHRVFDAIERFQSENGLSVNGFLDKAGADRLLNIALPMFDLWGFRTISHPARGTPLWVPLGLGLVAVRNEYGLHYEDPQHRLVLDFMTLPNADVARSFAAFVDASNKASATIHYKVFKDTWFVISSSSPGEIDSYLRYHQDGSNVTGFSLTWNNANGNVSAERIAILMSASLWSTMTGARLIPPPAKEKSQQAAVTRPDPPPQNSPEPQISMGTAFFVTQDGTLVTNAHVVDGCLQVHVKASDGTFSDGRVVARDTANDLAIVKTDKTVSKIAALRIGVRLGEGVEAFGYPHAEILSSSGNFTLGNVTALSGISDDSRFIQISAPVQAGNSGGPLLDQYGNLVGVVTSKLNALKVAVANGELPQNVNFAVKAAILASFLDSNRIAYQQGADTKPMEPADIADKARDISAFIACR